MRSLKRSATSSLIFHTIAFGDANLAKGKPALLQVDRRDFVFSHIGQVYFDLAGPNPAPGWSYTFPEELPTTAWRATPRTGAVGRHTLQSKPVQPARR